MDNQWTFGWTNKQTGYLELAGSSIHRLVAYAFHGNPLTDDYVVHHIDGDRQNNKLENLKWISRLESILMDQIVLSIVIHFCGSIEVFKENSLKLFADLVLYNFEHFSISKEEAMLKLGHLKNWAFTNSEKAKAILKKYENILGT
ncbi:MAG: HNH endonuclease [Erysipelotrichales bacterium]|nr:HNH endonuclease [Erysipelotrichales bacterium]